MRRYSHLCYTTIVETMQTVESQKGSAPIDSVEAWLFYAGQPRKPDGKFGSGIKGGGARGGGSVTPDEVETIVD